MRLAVALLALSNIPAEAETLRYTAEWRGLEAGKVELTWESNHARLKLDTVGLAAKLYHVDDEYTVDYDDNRCVSASFMKEHEGKKRKQIRVTYRNGTAVYSDGEQTREVAIPACTHDIVAGILQMRHMPFPEGQSITVPVSDGRKFADVRIMGQDKEMVKTAAGVFSTHRVEAFLFNGVIYKRKARAFLWFTEEERRIPVQMQVQLPFWIGAVTLKLQKEK